MKIPQFPEGQNCFQYCQKRPPNITFRAVSPVDEQGGQERLQRDGGRRHGFQTLAVPRIETLRVVLTVNIRENDRFVARKLIKDFQKFISRNRGFKLANVIEIDRIL